MTQDTNQPKSDSWLPIESAPKEGEFLVYGGTWFCNATDNENPALISHVTGPDFDVSGTFFYVVCIINPTHWRPLPSPPDANT